MYFNKIKTDQWLLYYNNVVLILPEQLLFVHKLLNIVNMYAQGKTNYTSWRFDVFFAVVFAR